MEKAIYHKMATIEDVHWWFIGRRFIIEKILNQLSLPKTAEVLEVDVEPGVI